MTTQNDKKYVIERRQFPNTNSAISKGVFLLGIVYKISNIITLYDMIVVFSIHYYYTGPMTKMDCVSPDVVFAS